MESLDLILVRRFRGDTYTIGSLYINGRFICNTLEPHCIDWAREHKVYGKTAIPEGHYKVDMVQSPSLGYLCPHLKDVPHFTGILIHKGNTVKHTKGCILVGFNDVPGLVIRSAQAFDPLVERISRALKAGTPVSITIR